MSGYTYDTGALIAAERGDDRMLALHKRVLGSGLLPTIPAGVLAQAWRGGPQAQLSRLLAGCQIEELTEARARSVGTSCGAAGTSDIVDASVVVSAASRGDRVVTSDPSDLQSIIDTLHVEVGLIMI